MTEAGTVYGDAGNHEQAISDRILNLRHIAALHFREQDWLHLGRVTGCTDLVQQHDRLGVLHWGDNDYDACVLQVLTSVVTRCPQALPILEAHARALCEGMAEGALAGATMTRI